MSAAKGNKSCVGAAASTSAHLVVFVHGFQHQGDCFEDAAIAFGGRAVYKDSVIRVYRSSAPVRKLPTFGDHWEQEFGGSAGLFVAYSCQASFTDVVKAFAKFLTRKNWSKAGPHFDVEVPLENVTVVAHSMGCLVATVSFHLKALPARFVFYDAPWFGVNKMHLDKTVQLIVSGGTALGIVAAPAVAGFGVAKFLVDNALTEKDPVLALLSCVGATISMGAGVVGTFAAAPHTMPLAQVEHGSGASDLMNAIINQFGPFIGTVMQEDDPLLAGIREKLQIIAATTRIHLVHFRHNEEFFFHGPTRRLKEDLGLQDCPLVEATAIPLNGKLHIVAHTKMFANH